MVKMEDFFHLKRSCFPSMMETHRVKKLNNIKPQLQLCLINISSIFIISGNFG